MFKQKRVLASRVVSRTTAPSGVVAPQEGHVPFVAGMMLSLARGGVSLKQMEGKHYARRALRATLRSANGSFTDKEVCPWCGAADIRHELGSGKRALWACVKCQRRWWASLKNPAKVARAGSGLSQRVFAGTIWEKLGGHGLQR